MSEPKHTPGPWVNFDNEYIGAGSVPWDDNWKHIAGLGFTDEEDTANPISESEKIANARLIAAAPDLLAATEIGARWMEWWIDRIDCDCATVHSCGIYERRRELERLQAAIAKARGQAVSAA